MISHDKMYRQKKPHQLGMKLMVTRKINPFQDVKSTHNTLLMITAGPIHHCFGSLPGSG